MIRLLNKLLESTVNGQLEWSVSSNPFEFYVYFEDTRYSIEKLFDLKSFEKYVINKWDNLGNPNVLEFSTSQANEIARALFESILKSSDYLNVRYNTYLKKMRNDTENKNRNNSVSLHKVMTRLGYETPEERPYIHINKTDYFYYKDVDDDNFIPRYVQPPMTQIPTTEGITPYQEAEVILISAPGATGKTAMSEYLSFMLKIPILNLGKHDAVGANSIGGLIMTQIEKQDLFIYHDGLSTGICSMIVDGLDEASIHITQESFEAFLKDVAFFAKGSKGLPFVILGRPSVMEDAALALEDNNIKVSLLQIEPFTVDKAIQFIDNQLPRDYIQRYEQHYKEVRDYIIDQVGGFFKNESELNKKQFEHFIGYAPVLQSISNLLTDEKDYHRLLAELMENRKQKIELLIDIVQRILKRERGKIHEEVLPQLFDSNHTDSFKESIKEKCGNEEEQCERILGVLTNKEVVDAISGDSHFDEKYNEKVNVWIRNHPFLKGNEKKIQNIVFESYLTAKFIDKSNYKDDILEYMNTTNSCSYLLLDIYSTLNGKETLEISHKFFPFLYKSFKALDHPQDIGNTEIISDEEDGLGVKCYLNFCRKELESEYDFVFSVDKDSELTIPSPLSALTIDAPVKVSLVESKVDIQAPTTITCSALTITSKDILLSTPNNMLGSIVFECNQFQAQCNDGNIPLLTFRTPKENNNFIIVTNSRVYHPFNNYLRPLLDIQDVTDQVYVAYHKLRRMLLMFRSHSNGCLARCRSKIDNRIGKSDLGRLLIEGLKEKKVLYTDETFYYINSDRFADILGIKYDDIRSSQMNDKISGFIQTLFDKK
jgi:hypothetical protein